MGLALIWLGCAVSSEAESMVDGGSADEAVAVSSEELGVLLSDRAESSGLVHAHRRGGDGAFHMFEILGSGVALLDHDLDGDVDVLLVEGAAGSAPARLFRNEHSGAGELSFVEATGDAGLEAVSGGSDASHGMGAVRGDIDRDGWPDVFLFGYDYSLLLRNAAGRFEDVAVPELAETRFTTAATFLDFDRDGWLDLFVGNYVDYPIASAPPCSDVRGARDYCGPGRFQFLADRLLRNRGDGTFEDVSEASGIGSVALPTLGVVAFDHDRDGWTDLYVANDAQPNLLWRNRGDGTFEDIALLTGSALAADGRAEASMGVDAADVDGDGHLDLFATHLGRETNTLYLRRRDGGYDDRSTASGVGAPSLPFTGFGTVFADFDLDGQLDVFVANGAIARLPELVRRGDSDPYHQPNLVLRGQRGSFVDASASWLDPVSRVSRGVATADLDNDGDADLVVTNNGGPTEVLLNASRPGDGWIGVRPVRAVSVGDSPTHHVEAPGALVALLSEEGPVRWRRSRAASSYASASDGRVVISTRGLPSVAGVRVRWPDGLEEDFPDVAAGRYTTVVRGAGSRAAGAVTPEGGAP